MSDQQAVQTAFERWLERWEAEKVRLDPAELCSLPEEQAALAKLIEEFEGRDEHLPDPDGATMPYLPAEEIAPETKIGPYRIVRRIGGGGMGTVYEAEQAERVKRQVALKVIKWGMDTEEVVARFAVERQALALMNHPNIARVLDAGSTDSGRPYFVMELVEGDPITTYCERRQMPLRGRLNLFIDVCNAVQHAHQKGVIHRDIKPSNLLVSDVDGQPLVKVIDFGLAKAMQQPLTEHSRFTRYGQVVGTPAYMSPEQTDIEVIDIDTRTDVYALGVLLYELLTGVLPFGGVADRSLSVEELFRRIREEEPLRPSRRPQSTVSGAAGGSGAVGRAGSGSPGAGSRVTALRGDLDWITLKAIAKDRDRRYVSAAELAADVRRHLDDEVILASPPTIRYRMRKFVRRHRALVGAVAAVLAVSLAAAVVSTGFALGQARARAEAERQAAITRAVNDFLNRDLLAAASPAEQGREVTVREVVDVAAERIDGRFPDEPQVEATLRTTVGETYWHLGRFEAAAEQMEAALALRRQTVGAAHEETIDTVGSLAVIYATLGRYEDAEQLYRQGIASTAALTSEASAEMRTSLLASLGVLFQRQQRWQEATETLETALAEQRRLFGAEHANVLRTMNSLAVCHLELGRFDAAETLLQNALEGQRESLGADHPATLRTLNNLASLHDRTGDYERAAPLFETLHSSFLRVFGADHPETWHIAMNRANTYASQGRYDEAAEVLEAALRSRRAADALAQPHGIVTMGRLAWAHHRSGHSAQAIDLFLEALAASRQFHGADAAETLDVQTDLAAAYAELGRHADAEGSSRDALDRALRAHADDPLLVARARLAHGAALTGLRRFDSAETELLEANRVLQNVLAPGDELTKRARDLLAALYEAWGKPERAAS